MILKEILFDFRDEESQREAIRQNFGNDVILNDLHSGWLHVRLLGKLDGNRYEAREYSSKKSRPRGLFYHDLRQLLNIS